MAPGIGAEMPRNSLASRMLLRGTWKSSAPVAGAQFGTPCRDSQERRMQERGVVKATKTSANTSTVINLTPAPRTNVASVLTLTPAKTPNATAMVPQPTLPQPQVKMPVAPAHVQIAAQVLGNICAGAAAKIGNATIGRVAKIGGAAAKPAVKEANEKFPQPAAAEVKLKVPQPLRQRKSMAQRMRLSVCSHLRSVDYRPRRRKHGKQRPSIVQKPSRRKVGKQRPSYAPVTTASFLRGPFQPITTEQTEPQAVGPRMGLTAHAQAVIGHLTKTAQLEAATSKHAAAQAQAAAQALRDNSRSMKVQASNASAQTAQALRDNSRSMKVQAGNATAPTASGTSKLLQMQTSGAERRKMIMEANAPERRTAAPGLLKRVKLSTAKRAEDNYDVSDLEEDADGNRIEPDRSKKRQPSWSADFVTMVNKQADINPDGIFGCQVPICDLDAIFPDKFYLGHKPIKKRRGSSCQWSVDRLTPSEVVAYSKKMGQRRCFSDKSNANKHSVK